MLCFAVCRKSLRPCKRYGNIRENRKDFPPNPDVGLDFPNSEMCFSRQWKIKSVQCIEDWAPIFFHVFVGVGQLALVQIWYVHFYKHFQISKPQL